MGAFVSDNTSPFFRRRKGRIGPDKWIEKTAPPLGGAIVRDAEGTNQFMVCCANAASSVQISKDGAQTWTQQNLIAPNVVGNFPGAGKCLAHKPGSLQGEVRAACKANAGGGNSVINANGNFNVNSFSNVTPFESVAYSLKADYIVLVASTAIGGNAKCKGTKIGSPVIDIDIPSTSNGVLTVIPITDPFTPYPAWIAGDALQSGTTRPFHKIHAQTPNDWKVRDVPQPQLDFFPRQIVQRGSLILSVDEQGRWILRSTNYGENWQAIDTGGGAQTQAGIYREGRFWFMYRFSAPRIRRSRNNGTTWVTYPVPLPSATAIPSASCEFQGKRYLFCNDGAANRCYVHQHSLEI